MFRAIDSNKSVEIKFSVHDTILESLSSGTLIVKWLKSMWEQVSLGRIIAKTCQG